MVNMFQHVVVSRAYKRLIYIVFLWTCVCVLVFKMNGNRQQQRGGLFAIDLTETNEVTNSAGLVDSRQAAPDDSNAVRGLLQSDYSLIGSTRNHPSNYHNHQQLQPKQSDGAALDNGSGSWSDSEAQLNRLEPLVDNSKSPSETEFLTQMARFAYKADHAAVRSPSFNQTETGHDPSSFSTSSASHGSTWSSSSTSSPTKIVNQTQNDEQIPPELNGNHNLPLQDWPRMKHLKFKMSSRTNPGEKCTLDYPSLYDIQFNNLYWQVLHGYGPAGPKPNGAGVASTIKNASSSTASSSTTPSSDKRSTDASMEANFYLYNAYYDDRARAGPIANVRILSMIDRVQPPQVTCLLWYPQLSQPVITPATYTYIWYAKWGNYRDGILQPYLINCRVPRLQTGASGRLRAPSSVSLTIDPCAKLTNNLRVINGQPDGGKGDFAVCVKGLDFLHQDLSVRLVEWFELLRLLGAQKVFLYELETHPNITKVLQHYVNDGFVELTRLTLPGNQPNLPGFRHLFLKNRITSKRQNELIPYNDCLYRNLNTFRYLALLDVDEVIMPRHHSTWRELMDQVEQMALKEHNYTRASYNVRNAYFLDDLVGLDRAANGKSLQHDQHIEPGIPPYMHMLNHVYRSRNYTKPGQYVKCFHNTERVLSLHNHFPLNCFGYCTTYSIGTEQAQLQHYRKDCVGPLRNACNSDFRAHTVRDITIWRYKQPLIDRVTDVLQRLRFFASNLLST